jgi:SAM-dependent methyltransferase
VNRHIDQFVDLNRPLPFGDAEFETVLLTDVLEHIAEPARLLGEIARVMKPGGKLVASVPFLYPLHEEPYDYYRYTSHKLKQFCTSKGLEPIIVEPYGGALEVILDIIAKHLYRHPLLSAMHLWLSRRLVRVRFLQALSADTQAQFPIGYSLIAQKSGR